MTAPRIRHNGKWRVMARMTANGALSVTWTSLGGCDCQLTAVRVWLVSLTVDKRQ